MEGIKTRTMIILLIILLALSGCVDDVVTTPIGSKSANGVVLVVNDAKNTSLYINSSNIVEIEPTTIEYGDTIVLEELKKEVDTIVFDGGISSNGFWLYEGLMYAPFGRVIKALDLCDSTWNKILHPISFDAEVNDWKR
jgi:hypothetical protein